MWKIVKDPTISNRYLIKDGNMTRGDVMLNGGKWIVELMMLPAFSRDWGTVLEAFAYVRGIEQAVNVYGKEMSR